MRDGASGKSALTGTRPKLERSPLSALTHTVHTGQLRIRVSAMTASDAKEGKVRRERGTAEVGTCGEGRENCEASETLGLGDCSATHGESLDRASCQALVLEVTVSVTPLRTSSAGVGVSVMRSEIGVSLPFGRLQLECALWLRGRWGMYWASRRRIDEGRRRWETVVKNRVKVSVL